VFATNFAPATSDRDLEFLTSRTAGSTRSLGVAKLSVYFRNVYVLQQPLSRNGWPPSDALWLDPNPHLAATTARENEQRVDGVKATSRAEVKGHHLSGREAFKGACLPTADSRGEKTQDQGQSVVRSTALRMEHRS
jgi:hypothetical protein